MNEDCWSDFCNLPCGTEDQDHRNICNLCRRPKKVCWCPFLPDKKLEPECKIILLQHPTESKRNIRTAPILSLSLVEDKFEIYKGKRFPTKSHEELNNVLKSPNTLLLYPSKDAEDIRTLPSQTSWESPYTLLIIDGTWREAKQIYQGSPLLHKVRHIKLVKNEISQYVIRTQPQKECLSTVETAAEALSILENLDVMVLRKPLVALCSYQLNYGAEVHHYRRMKNSNFPDLDKIHVNDIHDER